MVKFSHLENIEKTAEAHPDSFFIPTLRKRKSQKVGDQVRLHFHLMSNSEDCPRAERIWVTVSKKLNFFGFYKGILQNQPLYIDDLHAGDEITFKSLNIAQILNTSADEPEILNLKALATEICFADDECIRFMYRDEPNNDEDSGWRMFSGTEPEDFTNNPNNIRLPQIGWLTCFDSTLKEIIEEPVGSVYERENKNTKWVRVTDWTPENH